MREGDCGIEAGYLGEDISLCLAIQLTSTLSGLAFAQFKTDLGSHLDT